MGQSCSGEREKSAEKELSDLLKKELKKKFDEMDADGNGKLCKKELLNALANPKTKKYLTQTFRRNGKAQLEAEAKVEDLMALIDINEKDDAISLEEFLSYCVPTDAEMIARNAEFVQRWETKMEQIRKEISIKYDVWDKNGDLVLSKEELGTVLEDENEKKWLTNMLSRTSYSFTKDKELVADEIIKWLNTQTDAEKKRCEDLQKKIEDAKKKAEKAAEAEEDKKAAEKKAKGEAVAPAELEKEKILAAAKAGKGAEQKITKETPPVGITKEQFLKLIVGWSENQRTEVYKEMLQEYANAKAEADQKKKKEAKEAEDKKAVEEAGQKAVEEAGKKAVEEPEK